MCNKSAQMEDTSTLNNGSAPALATNDSGQQFFGSTLQLVLEFFLH
jgi:hypothetical protein